MNENGETIDTPPIWTWRGIEAYDWGGLWGLLIGKFRVLWYDPRERENWQLDCIFNAGVWQIGIGPLVLAYMRDEVS